MILLVMVTLIIIAIALIISGVAALMLAAYAEKHETLKGDYKELIKTFKK